MLFDEEWQEIDIRITDLLCQNNRLCPEKTIPLKNFLSVVDNGFNPDNGEHERIRQKAGVSIEQMRKYCSKKKAQIEYCLGPKGIFKCPNCDCLVSYLESYCCNCGVPLPLPDLDGVILREHYFSYAGEEDHETQKERFRHKYCSYCGDKL